MRLKKKARKSEDDLQDMSGKKKDERARLKNRDGRN